MNIIFLNDISNIDFAELKGPILTQNEQKILGVGAAGAKVEESIDDELQERTVNTPDGKEVKCKFSQRKKNGFCERNADLIYFLVLRKTNGKEIVTFFNVAHFCL